MTTGEDSNARTVEGGRHVEPAGPGLTSGPASNVALDSASQGASTIVQALQAPGAEIVSHAAQVPPAPNMFDREQADIERAVAASLAPYTARSILLPGIEAQQAMADEDKNAHPNLTMDGTSDERRELPAQPGAAEAATNPLMYPGAQSDDSISPSNVSTLHHQADSPNAIRSQTCSRWISLSPRTPRVHVEENVAMALCHLNFPDADTLVLVDTPAKQPEQSGCEYRLYERRCQDPHRVHSGKLKALNSRFFDDMLNPTRQFRIQRKRGLANRLPPGINYVMDLTPPNEGDDAAYLITQLSAPLGVRKWYQSEKLWRISKTLVGGYDEFEGFIPPDRIKKTWAPTRPTERVEDDSGNSRQSGGALRRDSLDNENLSNDTAEEMGSHVELTKNLDLPPEFSPVRNRAAIERVLHAIEGLDPKLDSAVKVWTFVAVAKYLDCADNPCVIDWVVRWMYADPNTNFIELHPDVSCKIGKDLRCTQLLRDSYAILVGEEALHSLRRRTGESYNSTAYNAYGRIKEQLDENDMTMVEYGSKSFVERIWSRFLDLTDEKMMWLNDLEEFRIIRIFPADLVTGLSLRNQLADAIRAYVRGRIFWTLCRRHCGELSHLETSAECTYSGYPYPSYKEVYNRLDLQERVFTRTAWSALRYEDFAEGNSSLWTRYGIYSGYHPGCSAAAKRYQTEYNFKDVQRDELDNLSAGFSIAVYDILSAGFSTSVLDISAQARPEPVPLFQQGGSQSSSQFPFVLQEPRAIWVNGDFDLPFRTRQEAGEQSARSNSSLPGSDLLPDDPTSSADAQGQKLPLAREKRRKLSETDAIWIDPDLQNESMNNGITRLPFGDLRFPLPIRQHGYRYEPDPVEWTAFKKYAATKRDNHGGIFVIDELLKEVTRYIHDLAFQMLRPANELTLDPLRVKLTDTLTCLNDDEWKYLPLWAGGNDDGTGGVFQEDVPFAVANGFSAPGPEVHCGSEASSENSFVDIGNRADSAASSASEINLTESTTVYPSIAVEDGLSETLNRKRVYDVDSVFRTMTQDNDECVANSSKDKGKAKDEGESMTEAGADDEVWSEVGRPLDRVDDLNMDDYNIDDPDQEGFGSDIQSSDGDGDGDMEDNDDGEGSDITIF